MQEMVIYGVSFDMVGKQPIVLLKTAEGNRFLPIWIGHAEASAILMKLQGTESPRPMTHDLITEMIEGLQAEDGTLHPIQQAFHENHGLQCGYCTPGMMMAAVGVIEQNPGASEDEIRDALEGNLCRCTGYQNIVAAVKSAADQMARS